MARASSRAQLIHASAKAKAQLITAHQVGGGATSAPLVQAHATPTSWSESPMRSASPGGSKKANPKPATAIQDADLSKDKELGVFARNEAGGVTQWRVGKHRFTQKEFDELMDRGMRGASLNKEQQAVFDAAKKDHDDKIARDEKIAEEKRVHDIKVQDQIDEEKRRNEEWDRRQKVQNEAQEAEEKRRNERADAVYSRNRADKQAEMDAELQRKKDEEAQVRIAQNRKYGLPDDYELTNAEAKGLMDRTHEYGLAPEDQKRADELRAEAQKINNDTSLSPEQKESAIGQVYDELDGINSRKAVFKRPDAVAQPQMSTVTGDDGQQYRVWSPDGKSWQLFDKKDPVVKEPTMNGYTRKEWDKLYMGQQVQAKDASGKPMFSEDGDGNMTVPVMRKVTPEEAIKMSGATWKPDANVPTETPAPTMGRESGEVPAAQTSSPSVQNNPIFGVNGDDVQDLSDFDQYKRK